MSLTDATNHGRVRDRSIAASTHVTALIFSLPKYTLPCCRVKPFLCKTLPISLYLTDRLQRSVRLLSGVMVSAKVVLY